MRLLKSTRLIPRLGSEETRVHAPQLRDRTKLSGGRKLRIVNGVAYVDGILVANKKYPLPRDYAPGQLTSEVQEALAADRLAGMGGTVRRALIEERCEGYLEARLPENIVIRVDEGDAPVGSYALVEITGAKSWILMGRILPQQA